MNVVFRTDATSQIGTGHFMRCMTLAEELQRHGAQIRFVSRGLPQYLRDMLATKGMELASLESDATPYPTGDLAHSHWLNASQEQDVQATKQALSGRKWDWLIVDHYALDARWESALHPFAGHLMAIDDIADRPHACDVLLDQNLYANMQERYAGKVPAQCCQLLGPRYALLRDEFRDSRKQARHRTRSVKRILVFFGGMDADNYTGRAIEALTGLELGSLQVDVVIGMQHPCRKQIEKLCNSLGYHCHVQTKRMAELMINADLALGAGGSSMWERCCLGLPALSVCVADNQRQQITDAAEQGLIYSLTDGGEDLINVLRRHISSLLENEPLRKLISRTAMQEVDGRGVNRVVAALGVNDFEIRIANESDSPKLFEWRNHQTIRAVSKSSEPIEWADHQPWFAKVQADKERVLLIGEIDNEPVGVVRFDQEGETALVSIYLVPEGGFKGQGRNLLLRAEEWLKEHHADIKYIHAEVLGANAASQRLFMGAGYRLESMHYLKEL
jgi:UDP-2,4-diacetamido-2,4,6-trideoxy-beta-L-altropyranose hydrolase